MALSKPSRLAKQRDFRTVFRRSQRAEGLLLSVRMHQKDSPPGRAAVVISNKVSKRASIRNKLRRRMVEWLRQAAGIAGKPVDLVITAKPGTALASKKELIEELKELTSRLRLI